MRHRGEPGLQADEYEEERPGGVRSARIRIGVGAGVVILIVALVGAVLLNAFAQGGSDAEFARPVPAASSGAPGAPAGPSSAAGSGSGSTQDVPVLVHVLGAVIRPGLVSLSSGARVVDAVAAAGGLTDDANVAGVNLARVVSDGEQLVVPRVGEEIPPPPADAPGAGGAGAGGVPGGLVNLNTATEQQLESLPRVGPAMAARILDWRKANGRFASVTDLMKVTGVGQKIFDGLKERITV